MRFLTLALLPLALTACFEKDDSEDEDESDNGGSDGLDPDGDEDGDGLTNGEEEDLGTDPENADSDGDGYSDFDENEVGTDPTDEEDAIYACGWPYNADKDDAPSDWEGRYADIGDMVPDASGYDQCGDQPHVYDFMNQGKPVIIDISAVWCGPCNAFASYLAGTGDSYGFGSYFPSMPDLIANGDVYWITILGETRNGGAPNDATAENWYDSYPDDHVAVIGEGEVYPNAVGWWPTFILTDETGKVISSAEGDSDRYMEALFYVEDEWGN